jgi:hypothetical protein
MKKLILILLAFGSFCPVCFSESSFMKEMSDSRDMQQLERGMKDIATQVRVAGEQSGSSTGNQNLIWASYLTNADRWEKEFPDQRPKEPILQNKKSSYDLNTAMIDDYASRLDRWEARMKARKAESSASADSDFKKMADRSAGDADRCFPAAKDENSPLSKKVLELYAMLKATQSPILHDADLTFIAYSMAAAMLDIKPAMPR